MNETSRLQDKRIDPSDVRYIKLGPNNAWANFCFENDRIEFGHSAVSHSAAAAGDWDSVRTTWGSDVSKGKASDFLREVRDFYTLDQNCLWITFAKGRLWWTFAQEGVVPSSQQTKQFGSRFRHTIGSWRSTDRLGKPLLVEDLSTRLSKTAGYRQTLCTVEAADYLLRVINAEPDPKVSRAREAQSAFTYALIPLIQSLHQNDFEILTNLLFSRLGWVRISSIGGSQKDTDLVLEQPATRQRALVQVKSSAVQSVLDDYQRRFEEAESDLNFFICHSPKGKLQGNKTTNVWSGQELAERVIESGLTDWVIRRTE